MTAAALVPEQRPNRTDGIGLGTQVGYGVGQIAGQVFRDTPSLLLLFFLTTVLGIAPAVAGTAIFVPKLVFGVGADMTVGIFSDRWHRKFPRRRWLLVGAATAPIAMIALFHVPGGTETVKVVYVAALFSLYMAAYATFSVPYLAIAGELTANPQERTVLMAWRLVFTALGVLLSSAVAPGLVERAGGAQAGYEAMARFLAVICPLALVLAWFSVRNLDPVAEAAPRSRLTPRQAIAVLLRPRFSVLCLVNIIQLAGTGMGYASMLYFLAYNMGRADALQVIGGLVVSACVGIIVAQPLWVWVAARIGKRGGYIAGSVIYSLSYIVWAPNADAGVGLAYVLAFTAAIGNSGWAMLGFSMVADIACEDEAHGGLYSAAWVASDKIGFALGGTLLVGLVLSAFGFDSTRAVQNLPQSSAALVGVMVAFGFLPAALNLSGAAILARWGRD